MLVCLAQVCGLCLITSTRKGITTHFKLRPAPFQCVLKLQHAGCMGLSKRC